MIGTRDQLWAQLATPEVASNLARTAHVRCKMYDYQYALLDRMARQYREGNILDIGGFYGRSALILSLAAPGARIVSLEPYHFDRISDNVAGYPNVEIVKTWSWKYFNIVQDAWDMIVVDGNHKRIAVDLLWFNRLSDGGTILFHDYTPRFCPVYAAINEMSRRLGRQPDVLIVDDELVGMAGFSRRSGEIWQGA